MITNIQDPDLYSLTKEEVKLILDHLEHQYINYDNHALLELLKEMRAWLSEQE